MKNIINKLYLTAITVLLLTSSCKKFGDTNIDPTRSSQFDPSIQLTTAQLRFSGDLNVNQRTSIMMTMPLVQQIAGSYVNRYGTAYLKDPNVMGVLWEDSYGNDIVNIIDAVKRTNGVAEKTNLNAICRIMKVYLFARMTDLYGDIPYSEAGKGTKPKFDAQVDIYNDFFKELRESVAQLNPAKDVVKADVFYSGDANAWKKFANSLRLRLAMRLVKIDAGKAKAEAQAAYDAGVFTTNADVCKTDHDDVRNDYEAPGKGDIRGNAISESFHKDGVPGRFTIPFVEQLRTTNDPRMKYMVRYYVDNGAIAPSSRYDITDQMVPLIGYNGMTPGHYLWNDWQAGQNITVPGLGAYTTSSNDQKVQPANFLLRFNAPFLHLTYSEVELLLAEASVRFGATFGVSAAEHYKRGMEAGILQMSFFPGGPTATATEINTFTQGNQLLAGKEIELINKQLWITLFLNGPESYANWRRSGFPVLVPGVGVDEPSESLTIPRRFEYPLGEKEQNRANFEKVLPALEGIDSWNKRVWWDKP